MDEGVNRGIFQSSAVCVEGGGEDKQALPQDDRFIDLVN